MIVSEELVKKLSQLGLNSYEAKLWTALLSQGVSTAGELSDIANVPRSRSYDVLESLEKKGFIIQKIGKPIKYVAIPPEEVLERVKKQIKNNAEQQAKQMEDLRGTEILNQLSTLHTKGVDMVEPTDLSGALRSRNGIYDHLAMLIKQAENEILIMSSAQGIKRKLSVLENELKQAANRGVQIKAITSGETTNIPEYIQSHQTQEVNARFMIADGKEMVFMLLPDNEVHQSYDVGIWVNTPYFAQAITDIFHVAYPALTKTT